jgi:ankyrin repeat protein
MLLKDKMSSIDYEDEENDTPLHWAVILDKPDSVSFLIEKGAQLTAINRNQNSPLMLACLDSNLAIIKLLLH